MYKKYKIVFMALIALILSSLPSTARAQESVNPVYNNSSVRGLRSFQGYESRPSSSLSTWVNYSTGIADLTTTNRRTDNPLAISRSARIPGMPTITNTGLAPARSATQTNTTQNNNLSLDSTKISTINQLAPVGSTLTLQTQLQPIRPLYNRYNRNTQFLVQPQNLGSTDSSDAMSQSNTPTTTNTYSYSELKQNVLANSKNSLANKNIFPRIGLAGSQNNLLGTQTLSGRPTTGQRNTRSLSSTTRTSAMGFTPSNFDPLSRQ